MSVRVIREELERASTIGAAYLMTHLGSARGVGEEQGRALVIDGLRRILDGYSGSTQFLIEISAGAGAVIGDTFEEVAEIVQRVEARLPHPHSLPLPLGGGGKGRETNPEHGGGDEKKRSAARRLENGGRNGKKKFLPLHSGSGGGARGGGGIGVCFDTQHAFASGYDLRTPEAATETLTHFDRTIGLSRLKMSHVNDSKVELGAHRDRHEHIGHGHIGTNGIRAFVQHRMLDNLPLILETKDGSDRAEDVRLLKEFRGSI